jgi:hypothetical protein
VATVTMDCFDFGVSWNASLEKEGSLSAKRLKSQSTLKRFCKNLDSLRREVLIPDPGSFFQESRDEPLQALHVSPQ